GDLGATVADSVESLVEACPVVVLMLADDRAVDEVLHRGEPEFAGLVAGRTLVTMSTLPPAYSQQLAADVARHGGHYVEAPVSGSRGPAEDGTLVAMVAGDDDTVEAVTPILALMCSTVVPCGAVPRALTTKLAVNIHLITLVTGLAEAFHFAREQGLDLGVLADVLARGPMSSAVSRTKADKLVLDDMRPQAQVKDVSYNCRVIAAAARDAGIAAPLIDACEQLFAQTQRLGHDTEDMIGVIHALRTR
ncbi:MAG TPA: NAD(P)-dependent oxidoreductase, partial [Kineosporiaceae bacterium]|nr:NAD(P)-dependent oxidoreductase [Kineosporiaceae bacterium]